MFGIIKETDVREKKSNGKTGQNQFSGLQEKVQQRRGL